MRNLCVAGLFLSLALSAAADDAAVDALVRQLGADDAAARDEAESKLVDLGSEAEARLRTLAEGAEPEVKARIERALEGIAAGKLKFTELIHERDITVGHTGVRALAWSRDGKRIASAGEFGQVLLWDAKDGRKSRSVPIREKAVSGLTFGTNADHLWVEEEKITCWDLAQMKPLAEFEGNGSQSWYTTLCTSPDGARVAWIGEGGIEVVDASTRTIEQEIPWGDRMQASTLAFSPDGKRLVFEASKDHLAVFDLTKGDFDEKDPICGIERKPTLTRLGWLADGQIVQVCRAGESYLGKTLIRGTAFTFPLDVSADGRRFATTGPGPSILVMNTEGKPVQTRELPGSSLNVVALSPDGKSVVAGTAGGSLSVWTEGKEIPMELDGHPDKPEEAVFSPDGSVLAVYGNDPSTPTSFVDLETGKAIDAEEKIRVFPGRRGAEFLRIFGTDVVFRNGRTGKETEGADSRHPGHASDGVFVSPDGTLGWCMESAFFSFTDAPPPVASDELRRVLTACARWSADSQYVAISGWPTTRRWTVQGNVGVPLYVVTRSGQVVLRQNVRRPACEFAWSPDGKLLYWAGEGKLHIFSPADQKEIRSLDFDYVFCGFLDEKRALAAEDGKLHLLYVPTLTIARTWDIPLNCEIRLSPDGKRIAFINKDGVDVRRFEVPKAK